MEVALSQRRTCPRVPGSGRFTFRVDPSAERKEHSKFLPNSRLNTNEGVEFLENLFGFVEKAPRQRSPGRFSAEAISNRLQLFFLRLNCLFEKSPKRPFPETFPLSTGFFHRLSEVQAFLLSKLFPSLAMRGHWAELKEPKR